MIAKRVWRRPAANRLVGKVVEPLFDDIIFPGRKVILDVSNRNIWAPVAGQGLIWVLARSLVASLGQVPDRVVQDPKKINKFR